ncbi:MAG: alpha/beta hydrolase-fold protein, partial [Flavobacteriales bacterium]
MKKLLVLAFVFVWGLSFAQGGKVMDQLFLKSKILDSERKYAIYLPSDYEYSEREYPVLYLLHGAGDDHTGWVQFGEVKSIADKAIIGGLSTAMIIVMPDAQTQKRGYFNSLEGDWDYENYFFQEFIPFIEDTYRIKNEKKYRAVAGLSMGGGGSFIYALRHPNYFSSACPLSASLGALSFDDYYQKNIERFKNIRKDKVFNYYSNHEALSVIKNQTDENLKSVRWYIDCGDDDYLYEKNSLAHIALKKRGIPHEY